MSFYRTAALSSLVLLLLAPRPVSPTTEDDLRCLRGLKQSLGDPDGRLDWNFSNTTAGFICSFPGISCWNPQQNRILSITLSSKSLTGTIPPALQFCRAAVALDLSHNLLNGSIPADICNWLPYLTQLDLSGNHLSGQIPAELSNCNYLNSLILSSNSLVGQIPGTLSRNGRIKELDLTNNRLTGEIPPSIAAVFPSSSFDFNEGLCGQPLSSRCGSNSRNRVIIIIAAGVSGALASLALVYIVSRCCFS